MTMPATGHACVLSVLVFVTAGSASCRQGVGGGADFSGDRSEGPQVNARAAGNLLSHEPPGYRLLSDQPWSAPGSLGWGHEQRAARSLIVQDPSAPCSPPAVLEHRYPRGFPGGQEPAVEWLPLSGRRLYIAMCLKMSDSWANHRSHVNKIWFLWLGEVSGGWVGNFDFQFLPAGEAGRWHFRMAPERPNAQWGWIDQNVSDETFRVGDWVHVEVLIEHVTGGQWRVKWWVDGVLAAHHSQVAHNDAPLNRFQIAPTWGGVGGAKPHDDYLRMDHLYLSQ